MQYFHSLHVGSPCSRGRRLSADDTAAALRLFIRDLELLFAFHREIGQVLSKPLAVAEIL
jgi:hypothetical protein